MVHSCEGLVSSHEEGIALSDETGWEPVLVLMAGRPETGKSTLARAIGAALSWPVIDKDVIVTSLSLVIP